MIRVEIHEGVKCTGVIGWDGSQYTVDPPDDQTLAGILNETLSDPRTGERVTAQKPDQFLDCLQFKYRSPYFRATAPATV